MTENKYESLPLNMRHYFIFCIFNFGHKILRTLGKL